MHTFSKLPLATACGVVGISGLLVVLTKKDAHAKRVLASVHEYVLSSCTGKKILKVKQSTQEGQDANGRDNLHASPCKSNVSSNDDLAETFQAGFEPKSCDLVDTRDTLPSGLTSRIASENLVVNYHFTRQCNYRCGFCFHTAKTSHEEPLAPAQQALRLLVSRGMIRVNFSGGEPFLKKSWLGQMCKFCKEELGINVSIVSNGSLITYAWFQKYGKYLDALAISCDSFVPATLKEIGREHQKKRSGNLSHIEQLKEIRRWCAEFGVQFKINSVVCTVNKDEDMAVMIKELAPCRWKVFQCLLIGGENASGADIRDARALVISSEEFDSFVTRHKHVECIVPENNETMRNSYLILDEHLRFLNNQGGEKVPTCSVLENVDQALRTSGFDCESFKVRSGEWFAPEKAAKFDW